MNPQQDIHSQSILTPIMKTKSILTLLLALGICAGVAEARGHHPAKKKLDTDGSGTLSLSEFMVGRVHPAKAKARFEAADANKDGQLEKSERAALREQRAGKRHLKDG